MGIPRRVRSPSRAHVDTNVLRFALDPDEDVETRQTARRIFHTRIGQPKMACSLPVAGEFLQTLAKEKSRQAFEDLAGKLWDYVRHGRLIFYGLEGRALEIYRTAGRIRDADPRLTANDALILASFLADEDAATQYTMDVELIRSDVVKEMCRAGGKRIRGLGWDEFAGRVALAL